MVQTDTRFTSILLTFTLNALFAFFPIFSSRVVAAEFTFTGISPVSDTLISVALLTPPLTYGKLVPYVRQETDTLKTGGDGNIWLIRKGEKIGTVIGPQRDHLFRFADAQPIPPHPQIFDKAESYTISSTEDPSYSRPRPMSAVGRKSRPVDSAWGSQGLMIQIKHVLYLRLPSALHPGITYSLSLPSALKMAPITFTYRPQDMVSEAIHVSQLGFRPDDTVKRAFVSLWAGSLGPISFTPGTSFHLIDETDRKTVFTASITLKKKLDQQDEDSYHKNYSGCNVYILDFSSFSTPGRYHILIDGVGCSRTFNIQRKIWRKPMYLVLRSFYHQRSDITLTRPYTDFQRPSPPNSRPVLTSKARLMDTGNGFKEGLDNFSDLIRQKTDIPLKDGRGGYHDAGDWDRRIQHLLATRNMLDLYTQFPDFFSTMALNIPESRNNLPDIIDEALWPLDFFCRLQEEDGSIRGGIEEDGDPHFGEPSWLDRHRLYAYRSGIWSTYLFAATAAQAARTLSALSPDRAQDYRRRALAAMHQAEDLLSIDTRQPFQVNDARNLAAIELFRLTKDRFWHQIFLSTTVFTTAGTPLIKDEHHDQAEAAWSYLQAPANLTDHMVRVNCRKAIIGSADSLVAASKTAGFGWLKDPWRPPFAGAFTIPDTASVIRAWLLTGDPRYPAAVEESIQFTLGANPLNICYITGLGHSPVHHFYYPDARISGQQVPAGITVLGPSDLSFIGDAKDDLISSYGSSCYPDIRKWPVLECFLDVFWVPVMDEFSLEMMARQVYSWGFLAAYPTKSEPGYTITTHEKSDPASENHRNTRNTGSARRF